MKRRGFLGSAMAGATAWLASGRAADAAAAPGAPEVAWSRRIPVRYEADVAVIGGGMAGVGAACAAASSGAKVILVERFAVAGGMLTTGGVANFCGQMTGQGEVFDEILEDLRSWKALGQEKRESVFHPEVLAFVLQELLLRRGVKLLLHARFADVRVDGGRITEAVVAGKSGPEALRARQFIDCTGDADVARAAGFAVMKGRPGDGLQLPMSMMYFVRHVPPDAAVPELPEGRLDRIESAKDLPMTSVWPDGPVGNAIKIKVPMFDSTDTERFTAGEIAGRRRMMQVMDFHRRVQKRPWMLGHCSPIIGIREGARIAGDYVLTVDDLRAGRAFDDAVARGTFMLDGHKPDDDKRTYILPEDQLAVPPYQIPLRCLVARDGTNLLMAGRCMSADQLALSSARVSTTCAMMGQAAGLAAAMAVKKDCAVRDLDPAAVRKALEARGAELAVGGGRPSRKKGAAT